MGEPVEGIDYRALLQVYQDAGEMDQDAGPGMLVMPLGSLRGVIAAHLPLEEVREDVRELVLDAGLSDGEIVMVTPETVGIIEVERDESN